MSRRAFTLVEILIATVLSLMLVAAAVEMISLIGGGVATNRGIIEISGRLRAAQHRLQADLDGMTAWGLSPPADPAHDVGYVEIIEGPGPWTEIPADPETGAPAETFALGSKPVKADGGFDSSVGDVDDVLLFTTRSHGEPFVGHWNGNSAQSQVAEVAWFVRGNKLYRRQLLVLPNRGSIPSVGNYYNLNDVSVRGEGGQTDPRTGWESRARQLTANTLGDLTKRENRFAHQPLQFPHDAGFWGVLGLPIMQETTSPQYPFPELGSQSMNDWIVVPGLSSVSAPATRDHWVAPLGGLPVNQFNGHLNALPNGTRVGEDVILTGVIGFDVKVWDPVAPVFQHDIADSSGIKIAAEPVVPADPLYKLKLKQDAAPLSRGAYVDLFYTRGTGSSYDTPFAGAGHPKSGLRVSDEARQPAVYCTWSSHYEADGIDTDGDGVVDQGTDGLDQDGSAGVDDAAERETWPPYPFKLLGIQVTLRVMDPDSGMIRQVTVRRSGSK